ncbi:hypothetical protein [Paraburkholderia sp. HD33-4]|uniref:hypothetical protein n=1 Tax=Paraburkholderia sp. HD33-4 TaxID=2883242 RepID=UPI001F20D755|nr:hypothetical protein [Paraburkholderia sp. HD33-4]
MASSRLDARIDESIVAGCEAVSKASFETRREGLIQALTEKRSRKAGVLFCGFATALLTIRSSGTPNFSMDRRATRWQKSRCIKNTRDNATHHRWRESCTTTVSTLTRPARTTARHQEKLKWR